MLGFLAPARCSTQATVGRTSYFLKKLDLLLLMRGIALFFGHPSNNGHPRPVHICSNHSPKWLPPASSAYPSNKLWMYCFFPPARVDSRYNYNKDPLSLHYSFSASPAYSLMCVSAPLLGLLKLRPKLIICCQAAVMSLSGLSWFSH